MPYKLYIPLFSATLLLSAALLFSVQPMFSKMILPLLGGTPNVWNTAMLFFQAALLLGYAYAHGSSRFLSIRVQAVLHVILLCLFTIVLPLSIPADWLPDVEKDPTIWQLTVMASTVGGPFFVLAASAPMLQRWFANSEHRDSDNPYFLYGASNLGSMGSLLLYPVLVEPALNLGGQASFWMYGYFTLIVLIAFCAALVWKHAGHESKSNESIKKEVAPVTWQMRGQWLVLAFIPSSLMLGVTTFITTDVASAPMIWIVPLAIYVGTFILVFAKKPLLGPVNLSYMHGFLVAVLLLLLVAMYAGNLIFLMGLHLLVFAITAWMCHSLLASKRPDSSHLTEFYLIMSVGGALGGLFNAIIAPQMFTAAIEYPLVLAAACFCRFWIDSKEFQPVIKTKAKEILIALVAFTAIAVAYSVKGQEQNAVTAGCALLAFICVVLLIDKRWSFAAIASMAFLTHQPFDRSFNNTLIHKDRNFFGIISIYDNPKDKMRTFMHGVTNHGTQSLESEYRLQAASYYSVFSPLNDVFNLYQNGPEEQHVAIAGLGAGAIACFSREGRIFDFFEIDPAVVEVAENPDLFTFLSDCGSPYEIILGDARMTLQNMPDKKYDIIVMDAFSSDNIPVHLITEEAAQLYLSKLKEDGVLVFHVSNNYLDLEPVLAQIAKKLDIPAYGQFNNGGELDNGIEALASHYIAMTHDAGKIETLKQRDWSEARFKDGVKSWSDKFSNIFSVIGNDTGYARAIEKLKRQPKVNRSSVKMEPITLDQEEEYTVIPKTDEAAE